MTEIFSGLVNAGGLGIAVAVLFWFHTRTLDMFEKALAAERDLFRCEIANEREQCSQQFEHVVTVFKNVLEEHTSRMTQTLAETLVAKGNK